MPQSPKANRGPSVGPQNRRALIDAAREVFAAEGLSAPLSSVAKRAGVGQGSLYRHFPDRTALAVAVFDENIAELEALAERPETILDDLLEHVIEQALVSTAIITFLTANPTTSASSRSATAFATWPSVSSRGSARRAARRPRRREDVLLAVSMLAGILSRTPAGERRATAKRAWGLFHAAFAPR